MVFGGVVRLGEVELFSKSVHTRSGLERGGGKRWSRTLFALVRSRRFDSKLEARPKSPRQENETERFETSRIAEYKSGL